MRKADQPQLHLPPVPQACPEWEHRRYMPEPTDIPVYGTKEAQTSVIVRCPNDASHLAERKTFAEVGGCPYCLLTPEERIAGLEAKGRAQRGG